MSNIQIGDRVRVIKDNPQTSAYKRTVGRVTEVPGVREYDWYYVVDFSDGDWDVYLPEQIEKATENNTNTGETN